MKLHSAMRIAKNTFRHRPNSCAQKKLHLNAW